MLKILEHKDSQLLKDFIDQLIVEDPQMPESTKSALNWYLTKLTESATGCYYFSELEDDKIIKVLFTMTVSALFNSKIKVYPFWIAGLVYSLQTNSTPTVTVNQLTDTSTAHYESMGYTTFFVVNPVPAHYSIAQINKYVARVITPALKYDYHIEAVIDDPVNYDDFLMFKMIMPKQLSADKRLIITRCDLKYEFRNFIK